MALRLWGCYSVADHLEKRAFVADLLLYDRLVVPVPSNDDLARWEECWNPTRLMELLQIADPFVERVEWNSSRREQFEREFSTDPEQDALGVTRRVILDDIRDDISIQHQDVRAVAVYAQPDRFDREWEIVRTFPFFHRNTKVEPGKRREFASVSSAEQQRLAKLVVTRLVVPDDGKDDKEVLQRTVDIVAHPEVAGRRAQLQEMIAGLSTKGLSDETIVGEIEDIVIGLNESIKRQTKARLARGAVQVITAAEGAVSIWLPPVQLATGPTAVAGDAVIQRRWGGTPSPEACAAKLLNDARRELGGRT
ncbi:hypothetical protein [Streptomyces sp. IMTB 2501]|uniref:hypothetical protein n=1 Tax=Streptomyces sp. IMTB 2501 TaxID=1776340 RepID=UPI00117CC7ED|nr:hypothetical protein [Streptomyces sp. IMTB 2501]